jgi:predicted permease
MVLLEQMIVLFILMGVGFFCGKKGFMNDELASGLSWIVVHVATPGMILAAGMNDETTIRGKELLLGFVIAIAVYVFLIALSFLVLPLIRVPAEDKSIYRVMSIFSNIGFMGLPILGATYGSEAVLYGSLFQFPFNLLMYTYGISAMRGENLFKGGNIKKALNVGVIACILAIVILVGEIPMPSFIKSSAQHLSHLAAPLSMMVIGQSMIHFSVKDMFGDFRLLFFSLIKLIAFPILGISLLRFFIQDEMLLHVCYIMLATPIGSLTAMVAQQYGGNYRLAAKGVALSTVMSVVTIPLISLVVF